MKSLTGIVYIFDRLDPSEHIADVLVNLDMFTSHGEEEKIFKAMSLGKELVLFHY